MTFTAVTWRLILSEPASGAWNMALDEALLESVGKHGSSPVIRLFSWAPPCLSLGYAQPASDVDMAQLDKHGYTLVRRPTGGRAILHTDELTYSVITPEDEPRMKGSILESYQRLSSVLIKALEFMGLSAHADKEYDLPQGAQKNAAVCFEVPSNYEITINGKKLIGSAQSRKHGAVLQHGSLPLFGDLTRILAVLSFESEEKRSTAARRLLDHATTVAQEAKTVLTWEAAADAMRKAFSSQWNLSLVPSSPLPAEQARATALIQEKYANPDWLFHR